MRKTVSGLSPVIAVDRRAKTPLHRQVYDAFRSAILKRHLSAKQQVPSTRGLALELGISRIPVLNAYAQLLAEGYFETRAGSGTYVSSSLPGQLKPHQPLPTAGRRTASQRARLLPRFKPSPWLYGRGPFSLGQPALEDFPLAKWSRLVARHCRAAHASSLYFSDPMGSGEFRQSIAAYLRTSRGVNCDARQIMVVNGSQQGLEITARALFDPGDPVWVEDPGYRLAWQVLTLAGCRLDPIPVDDEGMNIAAGRRQNAAARGAYVTPSHQFPLGVTMSAARRLQLLDWAQEAGAWIIEDDYDSEYRYEGMPIASLQGMDRASRVIYIGTFSKTLFPSLRLGYVVIPPDLIDRFVAVRHAMDIYPAHLYQAVLTEFMEEGHYMRHVRKTRLLYGERRNTLVEAIESVFGSHLEIIGGAAGMHLVAMLAGKVRDREVAARAAEQKLWLWPLSPCYLGRPARQGLILGFGSASAREIPPAVRRIKEILR